MNQPRLWTKDFLLLALINFCIAATYFILMIIMSGFAIHKLTATTGLAGMAAGIFILGAVVARLAAGRLIGLAGSRKVLFIGLASSLIMTLLYFGAFNITVLLAIRLINGIAFGLSATAANTLVGNLVPKERCGEGIGYFGLSTTFASAVGPFLGMIIIQHGSFSAVFGVCAIISALSLAASFFLAAPEIQLTAAQIQETKEFHLSNFFEPKVVPVSIICMLIYFCYSSIISFLTVYAGEIDLSQTASYFFVVFSVIIFSFRPLIGRMFDRRGENLIMYSAILLLVVGMLIFSQAFNTFTLLLAAAIFGMGFGAIQSSGQAIAVKTAEPYRMGLATATFYLLVDLGMGTGPYVFGSLISLVGFRKTYVVASVILALCTGLYYVLHGKNAGH